MAEKQTGTTVQWGIPSSLKTASDAIIAGIVQSVSVSIGGATAEITDEDGDIVTRVDHGAFNEISFEAIVTAATPELPEKGDALTFSAAVDGVALNTGKVLVESAQITHSGANSTTVSFTAKHYPHMPSA
jgi:hypothetical protein